MIPVIIIPVLKFYDKLQSMLDSIDYPVGHILIFDNGGELKNAKCEHAQKISIINFPTNVGVPTAWNLGVKLEPFAKYWLFSQDDIIWARGGLEKINSLAGPDNICIGMSDQRPFSSFTVGENVIEKVGLFDESFFPLVGDDFNFHKRCHFHSVNEVDISGTYVAEKSASIKELALSGTMSYQAFLNNFKRSTLGPPVISKWSLMLRRQQGMHQKTNNDAQEFIEALDGDYQLHGPYESWAFLQNLEVATCESCGASLRQ